MNISTNLLCGAPQCGQDLALVLISDPHSLHLCNDILYSFYLSYGNNIKLTDAEVLLTDILQLDQFLLYMPLLDARAAWFCFARI